jgi:hypothetical protein
MIIHRWTVIPLRQGRIGNTPVQTEIVYLNINSLVYNQ